MLKWIEATGKSEEAAIAAALAQLGMDRDEVSVEILDRAKSGFLGLRGTPARVKITYEAPDEAPAAPPVREKTIPERAAPEPAARPREAAAPRQAPKAPEPPRVEPKGGAAAAEGNRAEQIEQFLTGLLRHMQVSATPQITGSAEAGYQVVLQGEELGALIGRRGETLDAIQQLTGYAVNRGQSKRVRVHLDAENYRVKREESLERLAHKVAAKVVKYRRSVTLEPMNAYERHVIHAALQDYPGVTTHSIGTEPNRRTVVAYGTRERQHSGS